MKIDFIDDANLMKLLYVHHFVRSSRNVTRDILSYSLFYGPRIAAVGRIYSKFIFNQDAFADTFLTLLGSKESARAKEIVGELDQLDDGLLGDSWADRRRDVNAKITEGIRLYEDRMRLWVGRVFGFDLPGSVLVIADTNDDIHGNQSGSYVAEHGGIPVVGFLGPSANTTAQDIVDAMLHELLHAAVRQNRGIIPDLALCYEEALMDYFCPSGILSCKIGLTDRYDIADDHRMKMAGRPDSAGESAYLYGSVERYIRMLQADEEVPTIWGFLEQERKRLA